MKKTIALLLLSALVIGVFTACAGGGNPASSSEVPVLNCTFPQLAEELKGLMVLENVFEKGATDVDTDAGIDPDFFEEGFWICDITIYSAEMVAFYAAKDAAKAAEIKTKLESKLQSLRSQYENYPPPENKTMTENGVIEVKGTYVYMVISPNADTILNAIKAHF